MGRKLSLDTSKPRPEKSPKVNETAVAADASCFGLGVVLTQKQPDGAVKPIAFISRSMTSAEKRYAQ